MAAEQPSEGSTDGTSIKPVSSLRSHFENILSANKQSATANGSQPRQVSPSRAEKLEEPRLRADGRMSLDIPRDSGTPHGSVNSGSCRQSGLISTGVAPPGFLGLDKQKPRPISMGPLSPPRSPPRVTVQSPNSPSKSNEPRVLAPAPKWPFQREIQKLENSRSSSPQRSGPGHFRIPSRSATPSYESKVPSHSQSSTPAPSPSPDKSLYSGNSNASTHRISHVPSQPPPINRAGKPKFSSKPVSLTDSSGKGALVPDVGSDPPGERVSPFSTPPSSSEGSPKEEIVSSPAEISRPRIPPVKFTASSKEGYFKSINSTQFNRSISADKPFLPKVSGVEATRPKYTAQSPTIDDSPENRPGLPPRRDGSDIRSKPSKLGPPDPPVRRSMDVVNRPAAIVTETNTKFLPPPRRLNTAPTFPVAVDQQAPTQSNQLSLGSARASIDQRRDFASHANAVEDSDDTDQQFDKATPTLTDYPDSSQANRRPPVFKDGADEIPTKYETKLFAICGEYICTSGYVTRVWNTLTGDLLMNLVHGDTVKVTAMAFRPTKDIEEEGKRIWLGTNSGEINEIDIPTQSVVYTKANAHTRKEIIKIYRFGAEIWSLDEDGKINVWPPDDDGSPNLIQTPHSYRVPRGHTCSVLTGSKIWIASGKEIRVFQRTNDSNIFNQVLPRPLMQHNVGEVTSGTTISSQPNRIYFGHIDGKVSMYSRKDYSCLGIISVSLYKISALVGVGDYLWAGYHTGMIYVYDTTCTPWKVKKDWQAHNPTIAGIAVDKTSIWKLDRLQVASLGTDNMLRIWDGMLRDDWLETQMQERDIEFCDFREISAMVMTWNAGATKPTTLRHNEEDNNFFRDLLQGQEPQDILVFGFQELVDLEDKKVTAKSFFKSSKKKADTVAQEHMSHQYRAWRDHLVRQLEEHMPPSVSYTLLHTANLVGLFTCIFVKSSERMKIRDVSAAEVKRGMGGYHGNKGALIVRFILDDSSLCFINCHLAAGQTQTVHRNNDIAEIMESSALASRLSSSNSDLFVGGGDGSMILDHEICILNGDLNYRIDTMSRDTVVNAVKSNNLAKLLERDQLLLSRKKNPGFRLRAFREAPITFSPTYKYDVGTDTYDTSEKKRSPAWCDRLLYRGLGRIKQLDYRRHEVRVSDHRPVSGRFKLRVKTISPKRQMAVRHSCETSFEETKQRIAHDIKLDYLVNVLGLPTKEAQRLLQP